MPGRPGTGRVVKHSGEWLVLLPGRLPAYITPGQYEANLARMAANRQTAAMPGAPRDGSALLTGLLRCGRCGGPSRGVRYHARTTAPRALPPDAGPLHPANYQPGRPPPDLARPPPAAERTTHREDA